MDKKNDAWKDFAEKYHLDRSELEASIVKVNQERAKGEKSFKTWCKQQEEESQQRLRSFLEKDFTKEKWFEDIAHELSHQNRIRSIAHHSWEVLFLKNNISTIALESDQDDPTNYRARIVDLINGKPALFDSTKYFKDVKPKLNWRKISTCLSPIRIPKDKWDLIVMLLKPIPFTTEFTSGYPELEKLVASTRREIAPLAKRLAPIAQQLKNIPYPYRDLLPNLQLYKIAPQIKDLSDIYTSMDELGKQIPKRHFRYFGIATRKYETPQKQDFWTYAIGGAANELNKYCHDGRCPNKPCKEIHDVKVFPVIAQLLKTLYPTIWKESTAAIARNIATRGRNFIYDPHHGKNTKQ